MNDGTLFHFNHGCRYAVKLVFNFRLIHRKSSCTSRDLLWQRKKKHIKNNDDDAEYISRLSPKIIIIILKYTV